MNAGMSTRELQWRMKSVIPSLGGIYDSPTLMLQWRLWSQLQIWERLVKK